MIDLQKIGIALMICAPLFGGALLAWFLLPRRDPPDESGWEPTGRVDFSVPDEVAANPSPVFSPVSCILLAEDTRIVQSAGCVERREVRWRRANLAEAIKVAKLFNEREDG